MAAFGINRIAEGYKGTEDSMKVPKFEIVLAEPECNDLNMDE